MAARCLRLIPLSSSPFPSLFLLYQEKRIPSRCDDFNSFPVSIYERVTRYAWFWFHSPFSSIPFYVIIQCSTHCVLSSLRFPPCNEVSFRTQSDFSQFIVCSSWFLVFFEFPTSFIHTNNRHRPQNTLNSTSALELTKKTSLGANNSPFRMLRYLYNDNSHLFLHFLILFSLRKFKNLKSSSLGLLRPKKSISFLSVRFESQVLSSLIPYSCPPSSF